MTQEEKQLLLIDLCARLPHGVVLNVPTIDGSENKKLVSIVNEDDGVPCVTVYSTEEKKPDGSLISYAKTIYAICDVLPYLRPMSSMTEEEKEDLKKEHLKDEKLYAECLANAANGDSSMRGKVIPHFAADWCNKYGFDYRGLIPMGLALEAPEGMYKTE